MACENCKPTVERCGTCRFWKGDKDGGDEYLGIYRRYAPDPSIRPDIRYDRRVSWPTLHPDEWCGEYEELLR